MFYQTYRPQKFKDLLGNDQIVASITGAIKNQKLAHAFFFYGGRGSGKTTTARLLAKTVNCKTPIIKELADSNKHIHIEPCGRCSSCKAVQIGNHLDLIEIDAASNRGIDNIRELRETIGLSPTLGTTKVYIIDEVHMLTREASNALLKTLEEPPKHAYFVLCTTNPEKVLPTIKSRCIQHKFARPSVSDITRKLKVIVRKEGIDIADKQLNDIAVASKGAYREAETILEQISTSGGKVKFVFDKEYSYDVFIDLLYKKDAKALIEAVFNLYNKGDDLEMWVDGLILKLRSIILSQIGVHNKPSENTLIGLNELKRLVDLFIKSNKNLDYASIPTLPIEMAIIEYCMPCDNNLNILKNSDSNNETKSNTKKNDKSGQSTSAIIKKAGKPKDFPYKKLIEDLKPQNHSIYLILSACNFCGFDGVTLNISANFSFHKERLMSHKVRNIIEQKAKELVGSNVVLNCEVSKKDPKGVRLTDKNVVNPPSKVDLEEVFESVFGEDVL